MACELTAWMQMLALEGRSLFTTADRLPDNKLVEQDDHGPASRSTEPETLSAASTPNTHLTARNS